MVDGGDDARDRAEARAADNGTRLALALTGHRFGQVRWMSRTGSTNADLLALARAGSDNSAEFAHEQVLIADYQSAGRGRRDRQWESSPENALMMSVLMYPAGGVADGHRFTTAMGLAARDACAAVAGVEAQLKWPNDLVIDDRKLAGILAESHSDGDRISALVIGVGINVTADQGWSEDVSNRAVSLDAHGAMTAVDRASLAESVLRGFAMWCARSAAELRQAHLSNSATVGHRVRIQHPSGAGFLEGEAVDVDASGYLIVDDGAKRHRVAVGDVERVRRL